MKNVFLIFISAALAVSCVYPFEGEVGKSDRRLVVQGDIVLGDLSVFTVTYLEPLFPEEEEETFSVPGIPPVEADGKYPKASVWVEDEKGGKYLCDYAGRGTYGVFLKDADRNLSYRLRILSDGRQYSSGWGRCSENMQLDRLYYEIDESASYLDIKADFHSDAPASYYGISFRETWEYYAPVEVRYIYYPDGNDPKKLSRTGTIEPMPSWTYRCWKTVTSRGFHVLSGEQLSAAVFKDVPVTRIQRNDEKIAHCYQIRGSVVPLTEDAYLYMKHVDMVSSSLGDLFSPNPSEMRGNLRCDTDESELVIGFVSVTVSNTLSFYLLNSELHFYKRDNVPEFPSAEAGPSEWRAYNSKGWVPYMYEDYGSSKKAWWTPRACGDCRYSGGSLEMPAGWPKK